MKESTTRAHLRQLGLHPSVIERLNGYAKADGDTLQELVVYVLRDYGPAEVADEDAFEHATDNRQETP